MTQRAHRRRTTRGFTLVELMVAMAITIILMAGVYQFFIAQQRNYSSQDELNRVQQNARMAETLIAKAIQLTGSYLPDTLNATTVSMRDQAILAATDRYIVLQYDDPLNTADQHVVAADEVVAFVVSKTVPTAGTAGGTEAIDIGVHFDKNGDGTLTSADAHNFQIALNMGGPPYTLYRVTPTIAGGIVAEAVAGNVDNFVLRYFGRDGQPVVLDAAGQQTLANTGLTATERGEVRSVELELVLRTTSEDPNLAASLWNDFEAGSVVTRDSSGDIDAGFAGFTDRYRRRKFASRITPRSLAISNCGRLELAASDPAPNCPDGTTITATVLDQFGLPASGVSVIFAATDGTLSAGSATTDAAGQASVDLDYTGTAKPVMVSAQADVDCTNDGVTSGVTLHNSFVVNFQPGPWFEVQVTPPATTAYDTCPGFTFDFTTEVYDQCGNLVPPDPGLAFTATLAGGTAAPIAATDQLQDDQQTFTVSEPTAAGPWGTTLADFVMTVTTVGTPPANGVIPPSFDVTLTPWPPDELLWDSITPLPTTGYEDCPSVPQSGYFSAEDCFDNPIFTAFQTTASVDPKDADGPTGAGDQGTLYSDPSVLLASAAETISITTQSSGILYEVSYVPPTCTLDPNDPAMANGIEPTVHVQYDGVTTAGAPPELNQQVTLESCLDSCAITASVQPSGIDSNPLTLSQCEVPASVKVTVTRCNLDQKEVQLNLTKSGASSTVHFESLAGTASGDQITVQFSGNNPSVAEAYLVIEDAADGANIAVTADYLDASGSAYWTCDTLNVSVANQCTQLDIYTDPGYSQALTKGASDCISGINELYFEIEDCRFTANRVNATAPKEGLWVTTLVNGVEWDREPVDLDPYNIDPFGTGRNNSAKLRSASPTGLLFFEDSFVAVHDDGWLTYPPWGRVEVRAQYTDPSDPADDGCDETVALTSPLPICFPNAITSGGGAGWNGNFKAHWGDVVVRGNIALPAAPKRIEKLPTGQFNGSPFGGSGNDDRFVDIYVGKSFPGDTATGNYTGLANPDPNTVDQPFIGTNHGNYFRNITYGKITDMISVIDYDTMKTLAEDRGVYWYTLPSGDVRNPDTGQVADLETVLTLPGPGLENAYHDGDYIFVDTYGTATTPPNTTGFDIDSTPTASLPTFSFNGNLFTEGIIYVAGNVEFGGLGTTTNIAATTPPEYELHYDHNTVGWLTNESQLPIRSDPTLPQQNFTLGVHINGAFYTDGEVTGSGNPAIFGALTAERGYQGSGTPEIWYNYNLNVSGENNSLCVECCTLQVSPGFASVVVGDSVTLTGVDASGSVEWTIAGNWPDVAGQVVATVDAITGVVSAQNTGWVQVRGRDINNCVAYGTVWVAAPCDVFSSWSNADPNWAQLDIGDGQRFTLDYTPSGAGTVTWNVAAWSDQSAQIIGSGVAAGKDYVDVLATCGGTWTVIEAHDPSCPWPLELWVDVNCPSPCSLNFAATPTTLPTGGSYTLAANTDLCEVEWQLYEGGALVGWAGPGSTVTGTYASMKVDTATPLQAELSGLMDTPAGIQVSVQANTWCDAGCTDSASFDVAACSAITVTQNTAGSPLQVGSTYAFTAAGGTEDYTWRLGGASVGSGTFSVAASPDTEFADFTPTAGGSVTLEVEDASGCTGATPVQVCGLALDTAAATVQVSGATTTVNASGAAGTVNWTWTTPDGANLGLSTTSGNSTTVTGLVTGTATLTATDDGVAGCSATAAIRVIPAPGAWTQLIYEDFEGALGNFVSGGTDALLYTYSSGINFAAAGTGALDIQDDTGDTAAAALGSDLALASGLYTELEVEFQYYAVGINTGDGFSLQFSSDGGATWTQVTRWTEGAEFANDAFYSDTVTIPTGSYPFTDAVRLRFECHGATNNDDVYIDEVRIRAR